MTTNADSELSAVEILAEALRPDYESAILKLEPTDKEAVALYVQGLRNAIAFEKRRAESKEMAAELKGRRDQTEVFKHFR